MTFDVVGIGTKHTQDCYVCGEQIEGAPTANAFLLRNSSGK
jgi:hypothetical protein